MNKILVVVDETAFIEYLNGAIKRANKDIYSKKRGEMTQWQAMGERVAFMKVKRFFNTARVSTKEL